MCRAVCQCFLNCIMSVCAKQQAGPGVGAVSQGAVHAAGGPSSNGDKPMHVRKALICLLDSCLAVI